MFTEYVSSAFIPEPPTYLAVSVGTVIVNILVPELYEAVNPAEELLSKLKS